MIGVRKTSISLSLAQVNTMETISRPVLVARWREMFAADIVLYSIPELLVYSLCCVRLRWKHLVRCKFLPVWCVQVGRAVNPWTSTTCWTHTSYQAQDCNFNFSYNSSIGFPMASTKSHISSRLARMQRQRQEKRHPKRPSRLY